jgi:hypothetical protein
MNAITHKAAYSFFPRATFEARKNAVCRDIIKADTQGLLEKYRERGWDYSDSLSRYPDSPERWFRDLFHYRETRWVGDKYCWTLPLMSLDVNGETDAHSGLRTVAQPRRRLVTLGRGAQDIEEVELEDYDLIALNGWTLSWVGQIWGKGYFSLLTDEVRAFVFGDVYQVPREYRRAVKTFVRRLDEVSRALPSEYSTAR